MIRFILTCPRRARSALGRRRNGGLIPAPENASNIPLAGIAPLALLLALSACLLPDSYQAEVVIHADGAYTARFDGDLLFVPARREMKGADEAAIAAAFADVIKPIAGVVAATPKGDAVWHVRLEQSGRLQPGGNALPGPDRFLIINLKEGEAHLGTPDLTAQHQKQLKGFGPSAGSLCIRTDVPVLSHNADTVPAAAGGCYQWHLDSLAGRRAEMRLKM